MGCIKLGVPARPAGLSLGGALSAAQTQPVPMAQLSASYSLSGCCSQTACGHLPAASQQKSVAADQEEFLPVRHSERG